MYIAEALFRHCKLNVELEVLLIYWLGSFSKQPGTVNIAVKKPRPEDQ